MRTVALGLLLIAACHRDAGLSLPGDLAPVGPGGDGASGEGGGQDLADPGDLASAPDGAVPRGAACGGILNAGCPPGQFCEWPVQCGQDEEPGRCTDIPVDCTSVWSPVCGCDGVVYSNNCQRQRAGASAMRGECGCGHSCPGGRWCAACPRGWVCLGPNDRC